MFYKYLPPTLLDVIQNLTIRFSQPTALNDPYEALPLIKYRTLDSASIYTANGWVEIPNQRKGPITPEDMAKYGQELIDRISETFGVLSLSRTNKNLLLWSHYADSHRGYVIELDNNNDFFKSNHKECSSDPVLVSYTSERLVIDEPDNDFWVDTFSLSSLEFIINCLKQKPIDWAYEEEVRVFRNIKMLPIIKIDAKNCGIMVVPIPPTAITGIYLGSHIEYKTQEAIKNACKEHKLEVPIYKASLSNTSYSLEFKQIND